MDDDFDEILKSMPEKWSRSRLAPYARLIYGLLRRGRTYREVVSVLCEKYGVRASVSTVHYFVRRRAVRARKARRPALMDRNAARNPSQGDNSVLIDSSKSQGSQDEVSQRIAALKSRPTLKEPQKEAFHYDPNEPLLIPVTTDPKL
jgi:hypothetical protein